MKNQKSKKPISVAAVSAPWYSRFTDAHIALLLFLFAFTLRLVVYFDYTRSPFFGAPQWDANLYWKWAQSIAGGNVIGSKIFHQAPLYPYFVGILIAIFGKVLSLVYIVQAILSAVSVSLLFLVGKRLHSKAAGIVAALLFSFYGMSAFYSVKVLTETLALFLLVLLVFILISAKGWRMWLVSGIVCGLVILCRSQNLLLVPLILLYAFLRQDSATTKKRVICFAAFLIPIFVLLTMTAAHNWYIGQDLVLIASNGGENFYIGNHEKADGLFSGIAGVSREIEHQDDGVLELAEEQSGQKMKRSEASRFWFHKGISFIRKHPGQYLRLELKKLVYLVSGHEYTSMYYLSFERKTFTPSLWILFVNYYMIIPFALCGLILMARQWRALFLPYAIIGAHVFSTLAFFHDSRFRLPVDPFIILFAAFAVFALWRGIADKHPIKERRLSWILLAGAIVVTLLIYDVDRRKPSTDSHMYTAVGDCYFEKGWLTGAYKAYYHASELNKDSWMPVFDVAKVYFRQGKKDVAADLYREAIGKIGDGLRPSVEHDDDLKDLREYVRQKAMKDSTAGKTSGQT